MSTWTLHEGDCLDLLRGLPAGHADAVVTDPPYGLSDEPDPAAVLRAWLAGKAYHHARRGFMGKAWDSLVPGPDLWREVLRVLRPGGYLVAFGGTRTWDLLSMALRLAGFQNRDTVRHDFGVPALGWVQGQGFPKSKAGLKPAWEPVLLFRRPGPVQALRIDDCRVGTTKRIPASLSKTPGSVFGFGFGLPKPEGGEVRGVGGHDPNLGRWPANVVLTHAPGCERLGEKRVKGSRLDHKCHGVAFSGLGGPVSHKTGHTDADGLETVDDWRCVEGCPVKELEEQNVHIHSAGSAQGPQEVNVYGRGINKGAKAPRYGDTGTAARFFHQFQVEPAPFFYTAKACRKERSEGCDALPRRAAGVVHDDDGYRAPGERKANHTSPLPRANHHPTVKPVALMRHLVRLVTPPGGLVLDPFAGSGTTGVAALQESLRFLGAEREPDYAAIARARLEAAADAARAPGKRAPSPRPRRAS